MKLRATLYPEALRRRVLEDIAARAAAISDLARKDGLVREADQAAETSANAQIELAFLPEPS